MNVFDFQNADIQNLAIHIRETVWGPGVETIPIITTTGNLPLFSGQGRLVGVNLVETTGAATAACDLLDGVDGNGTEFLPYTLIANQSARDQFPPYGWQITRGLFLRVTAGSVRGSVQIAAYR